MAMSVATIGNEGLVQRDVLDALFSAGVDHLYLRELGTSTTGRLTARSDRHVDMRTIFNEYLFKLEVIYQFEELRGLTAMRRCLLCHERQPHHCHRAIVADRLDLPTRYFRA